MRREALDEISAWITQSGLSGAPEIDLLNGFCDRCLQAGLDLSTSVAIVDTLHPIWEGRAFFWRSDGLEDEPVSEYASTKEGERAEMWQRTSFYYMLTSGESEVRRRIGFGDPLDFYSLDDLLAAGHTDCFALVQRFASDGVIGEMDSIYSHWVTKNVNGFSDEDCAALRHLVPFLALALKAASLSRIASTLVDVYLGQDAGQRVLSGRISRGATERINAVLWFSDLCGFTTIADSAASDEIIHLLDDYAEAVIASVHENGGSVLKLIGDGILAIFKTESNPTAGLSALQAEAAMRRRLAEVNTRRSAEGRPTTGLRLGLHLGDVFYGNIGSDERLDFTVVGPAVNEVSRIVSMGRTVERDFIASAEFVAALPESERSRLTSLGQYPLRGVSRPRELFTLASA